MLKLATFKEKDHDILVLEGEIDASNSVELDERIQEMLENGTGKILVDGRALDYISSAGLGVFMSYLDEFEEKKIQLVIFGLSEKVHQVFIILGLNQLIPIKSTKEEAIGLIYEP
jgi:anti-sigma B factor antagonist